MGIKSELYETVRRSSLKVGAIADRIDMGESMLYKSTTPESGVNFPLEKLVPLMSTTGDYRVLKRLNRLCGFAEYKIPASKLRKSLVSTAELQKIQANLIVNLHAFYESLNDEEKAAIDATGLIKEIEENIRALAAVRADVQRRAYGQSNLFDGEDGE